MGSDLREAKADRNMALLSLCSGVGDVLALIEI